jgi:ethanolamine utilization microcompartment shell protein EutS
MMGGRFMEFTLPSNEGKMRIVQELVPGKQVTLAHIIASPDEIVYKKLGLNPVNYFFAIRPIVVGLLPKGIYRYLHTKMGMKQ